MKDQFSKESKTLPEVAFYYPNSYFFDPDWAKNLILFFDGIGMLIPNYMKDHSSFDDLPIIASLKEHGLFHVIEPETAVDEDATLELASKMTDIITSGALDKLNNETATFGYISMSRLGFSGDAELAQMIFEELKSRGLARDTEDGGYSIPINTTVRSLILVLLAHILQPQGQKQGLDLSPATDRPSLVEALEKLVSTSTSPTVNDIITFDMNTVGVDLGSVPIEEVLAFRKEHYSEHRNYTLCVRKFLRELSVMEAKERNQVFEARLDELESIASDLRKLTRKTLKDPASSFSLAGILWKLTQGDLLGAALMAGRVLLGSNNQVETGVYSYLFKAHSNLSR